MTEQSNRVAIVTGASRGIGATVAERLARDGFTVIVNYPGEAASAEAVVRKIEEAGGRALAVKADVSDPDAARGLFDAAETAFGGIDVLVNNAGIMTLATIADTDDASFDRHMAVTRKLIFVPAGHDYCDWHEPRTTARMVFFFFDPATLPVPAASDGHEVCLAPRLFFEDAALFATAQKLTALIEGPVSDDCSYLEALGRVLAHELMRVNQGGTQSKQAVRGGACRLATAHRDRLYR